MTPSKSAREEAQARARDDLMRRSANLTAKQNGAFDLGWDAAWSARGEADKAAVREYFFGRPTSARNVEEAIERLDSHDQ